MLSELKILTAVKNTPYGRQLNMTFDNMGFDIFKAENDPILIEIAILKNEPDAVIINTDNMDFSSVKHLIKNISNLEKPPYVLALYTYESADIEKISKLDNTICIEMPANFTKLCDEIKRIHSMTKITLSDVHAEIKDKIVEILKLMNFSPKMFGYIYLREALFIAACSDKAKLNFSREVYPEVARKHDSNSACVERAIRIAIKKSWPKTSLHIKNLFFNADSLKNHEKPTNNEFIMTIGLYIRDEYRNFIEKAQKDNT